MVRVLTPVFQEGSPLNRINDNYLSGPAVSLVHQFQLDPPCQDKSVSVNPSLDNFQTVDKVPLFKTKNLLAVYCPVVLLSVLFLVLFFHTGIRKRKE